MVTPESQITFQFLSDPYVVLIRFTLYWHITALMYSVFDEFMHLIINFTFIIRWPLSEVCMLTRIPPTEFQKQSIRRQPISLSKG
jgi:hypothetical protein